MRARFAHLLLVGTSSAVLAAPIDSTGYALVGCYQSSDTYSDDWLVGDGEHLLQLDSAFRRFDITGGDGIPGRIEQHLLPSIAGDALRFGGELRVLESGGAIWSYESGRRIAFAERITQGFASLVQAGSYLVAGGTDNAGYGFPYWSIFRSFAADSNRKLALACATDLPELSLAPVMMVADGMGGIYFGSQTAIWGARVGAGGCVEPTDMVFGGSARAMVSSPSRNLVCMAQDSERLAIYRAYEPGRLQQIRTIPIEKVSLLAIWHDERGGMGRLAAATRDSLIVWEIGPGAEARRIMHEGGYGSPLRGLAFLGSGRLITAAEDSLCIRFGHDLALHRHAHEPLGYVGTYFSRGSMALAGQWPMINKTRRLPSGAHRADAVLEPAGLGYSTRYLAGSDSVGYLGFSDTDPSWMYVLDLREGLTLVDSLEVMPNVYTDAPLRFQNDFLITSGEIFDVRADPWHPTLVGDLGEHHVRDLEARSFPGDPDATLLLSDHLDHYAEAGIDSFFLWRVDRETGLRRVGGVETRRNSDYAFDDTREILYTREIDGELLVWDISDLANPTIIHRKSRPPDDRGWGYLTALDGVLHVSSLDSHAGHRDDHRLTALSWTGEELEQLGPELDFGFAGTPWDIYHFEDEIVVVGITALELTFDPVRACSFGRGGRMP